MPGRRAFITGITGQDGSYLAELLLAEGYDVVGLVRPGAPDGDENIAALRGALTLVEGDLLDSAHFAATVAAARPDEVYHLGAPTFVPDSWTDPTSTMAAIAGSTSTLLATALRLEPRPRVFVAASAEIFGDAGESPQHERSPMRPRSPYGVAKLAAHGIVGALREHHGLFACSGITYNHESPRRPVHFLPRKVTSAAVAIAHGRADELVIGDLGAVRDWSHARDIVRGAWLALQADAPGDYVFASGVGRSVGELVDAAFAAAGTSREGRVRVDPAFVRTPEPTPMIGDPSLARERLGWVPGSTFEDLIAEMVAADVAALG